MIMCTVWSDQNVTHRHCTLNIDSSEAQSHVICYRGIHGETSLDRSKVLTAQTDTKACHDDVIKWKPFPRYWPFVREIHRSLVNFPHKGQRHEALMFSLICAWINSWVSNRKAGDLRRHRSHYDVIVMDTEVCQLRWQWYICLENVCCIFCCRLSDFLHTFVNRIK